MKTKKKYIVEYSHNNSGGRDWVTQDQYKELLSLGWKTTLDFGDDYINDVEKEVEAYYIDEAQDIAIDEWETVTGQYVYAEGCECCGPPHSFHTREVK